MAVGGREGERERERERRIERKKETVSELKKNIDTVCAQTIVYTHSSGKI
jgi:hypothetical protein